MDRISSSEIIAPKPKRLFPGASIIFSILLINGLACSKPKDSAQESGASVSVKDGISTPVPTLIEPKGVVWKTYKNDLYGFEMQYPSGWSILPGSEVNKVSFRYENVSCPPYDGPCTIDVLVDNNLENLELNAWARQMSSQYGDDYERDISSSSFTIGGQEALTLIEKSRAVRVEIQGSEKRFIDESGRILMRLNIHSGSPLLGGDAKESKFYEHIAFDRDGLIYCFSTPLAHDMPETFQHMVKSVHLSKMTILPPRMAKTVIEHRARATIRALKDKDFKLFSTFVHPEKGVQWGTVSGNVGMTILFSTEIARLWEDESPRFTQWGEEGPVEQISFKKYYERVIYDRDFANAPKIGYNQLFTRGTSEWNPWEDHPTGIVVEYFVPSQNASLDWRVLSFVFEEYHGEWYLVRAVHIQWGT